MVPSVTLNRSSVQWLFDIQIIVSCIVTKHKESVFKCMMAKVVNKLFILLVVPSFNLKTRNLTCCLNTNSSYYGSSYIARTANKRSCLSQHLIHASPGRDDDIPKQLVRGTNKLMRAAEHMQRYNNCNAVCVLLPSLIINESFTSW